MNLQSVCEKIGQNGCLILCDCYIAHINPIEAIEKFSALVDEKIVREDCYVLNHEKLIYFLSGRRINYIRTNMPPENCLYISNWVYNKNNHFVVMKNNQIVWNPLDYSVCVNKGKQNGDYRYIS